MGRGEACAAAVGRRKCNARRDHRPVRRAVEAGAPDRAAVDFAPVEMGKGSDFSGTELWCSSRRKRRPERIR